MEEDEVLARAGRHSRTLLGHRCLTSVAQWQKSILQVVCDNDQLTILDPALRGVVLLDEVATLTEGWNHCLEVLGMR